jgi:LmbE family N-acetylglucosaminyl deacetylase
MRIVHIHAHPDDAEMFTGGTLALLAGLGHEVTIVSMTPGDCGTKQYSAEQVARMRRAEAAKAAELIGAKYICAEFRDLAVFVDDASRRRVTAILRKTRPDIVLTASPIDYHCDHEATSKLVLDACFAAPAPNYDTSSDGTDPAIEAIPHLYFVDPAEGTDRDCRVQLPQFLVDVSSVMDKKRAMLNCHDSQRQWLKDHHGMDNFIETMDEWTALRGKLLGMAYGEGFRQYKMHPYPTTGLLQELLGESLVKHLEH